MPLVWSILIWDEDHTDVELIPLKSWNDRGFRTIMFNPLAYKIPLSEEIKITDAYSEVKWFFPKLKNGHILAVPLEDKPNPVCAYFVKDINKQSEIIDFGKLL